MTEEELIPEIKDWKSANGNQFSIEDWIVGEGNIKLAIGYSKIFWPEFMEHDNCVFLKSHFSIDNYNQWEKADYVKHYAQIEGVMNHVHILDLFQLEKQDEINKEQVIYLGKILRDIYETKLKSDFPNRRFEVSFGGSKNTDDLIDYEVTFYQPENEKRQLTGR